MSPVRRLGADDAALWMPLFAPHAAAFRSAAAHAAWVKGLVLGCHTGAAALFGVGEPLDGALALQGNAAAGLWRVAAVAGAFDAAAMADAWGALAGSTRWLVWAEDVAPGWAAEVPGAMAFERCTYTQDLARVPTADEPSAGVEVRPFDRGDEEAILALHARVNAVTLEGFFLTDPLPPTAARCTAALAAAITGPEFLPAASFTASVGSGLAGSLLCVGGPHPHEATLFDLVVDPDARGRGLSRHLVRAWQGALKARGYATSRYVTMGGNVAVHRLFRDEEILDAERTPGGALRGRC